MFRFTFILCVYRYEHFDYELCQKILQLLKGAYPARLKKVLIVGAPLWFRAPFKILRLFVREKLRDRVSGLNKLPAVPILGTNPNCVFVYKLLFMVNFN